MRDRKNLTKDKQSVTTTPVPQIIKKLNENHHNNCKRDLKKKTKEILQLLL